VFEPGARVFEPAAGAFEPAAGAAGDVPRDAVFHGARDGIADFRSEI